MSKALDIYVEGVSRAGSVKYVHGVLKRLAKGEEVELAVALRVMQELNDWFDEYLAYSLGKVGHEDDG